MSIYSFARPTPIDLRRRSAAAVLTTSNFDRRNQIVLAAVIGVGLALSIAAARADDRALHGLGLLPLPTRPEIGDHVSPESNLFQERAKTGQLSSCSVFVFRNMH